VAPPSSATGTNLDVLTANANVEARLWIGRRPFQDSAVIEREQGAVPRPVSPPTANTEVTACGKPLPEDVEHILSLDSLVADQTEMTRRYRHCTTPEVVVSVPDGSWVQPGYR